MVTSFICRSFVPFGTLIVFACLSYVFADNLEEVSVEAGEDVLLKCQGPRNSDIIVVEWQRPDIKMEDYVLFYREGRPYESYQHPSYRGRVRMVEPQMKDGNVSIILSHTTVNDSGTYRCSVSVKGPAHWRRAPSVVMNTIRLTVTLSGHKEDGGKDGGGGVTSLAVTLPVLVAVLLLSAAAVLISRRTSWIKDEGLLVSRCCPLHPKRPLPD
ncbi:butyrophilin-like protein 2 isoform X2 [Melanotaenia boesemani]|uniref:butyrophilin-like protein 2 isoform X2 n=1 Tax=Melanotaenia boesemani TaxID=1250792 RepID=UPI001C03ACA8|nr:butyrophilin-like protein 2 isoform X2 [Melanotaenia boesemani]